jgi:hypothetical protein
MLAGLDGLGCSLVGMPNGPVGSAMGIDPATGRPAWLPSVGGGPVTMAATLAGGVLSLTMNGTTATVNLHGHRVTDAFGVPLGYLLPT